MASTEEIYTKLGAIHSDRWCDVCDDLAVTAVLFKKTKSRKAKESINKLREILIREKHYIETHKQDNWREL